MSGVLFVALVAAAVLTPIACLVILASYRRGIQKVIQLKPPAPPPSRKAPVGSQPESLPVVEDRQSPALLQSAQRRLARLARVYLIAGAVCSALSAMAILLEASAKGYTSPLVFFVLFSWPIVLCWNQIAGWDSRARRRPYLIYAAVFVSVWLLELLLKHGRDPLEIPFAFLLVNAIPTLLIFCLASPAIKTIGPCIFSFCLVFVSGAWSTVHLVTTNRSAALVVSRWTGILGLSPEGAESLLVIVSFIAFLPVGFGWMLLLIRGYAKNYFSEQSVRLDSLWLVVALIEGVIACTPTATSTGRGVVPALLAFPAYWLVRATGLRWARRSELDEPQGRVSLLYLRRFALRGRADRLFQTVTLLWRPIGDVVLIGGPDLARSTIQPHSLLQFLLRRTKRSLISSKQAMEEQLARLPGAVDLDTRSRITDFLCTEEMWQDVVSSLMGRTDKVIADFRGITSENRGSLFEIEQMVSRVPVERIVILADSAEAKRLVEQTINASWPSLPLESPNYLRLPEEVKVVIETSSDRTPLTLLNHLFSMPDKSRNPGRTPDERKEKNQ